MSHSEMTLPRQGYCNPFFKGKNGPSPEVFLKIRLNDDFQNHYIQRINIMNNSTYHRPKKSSSVHFRQARALAFISTNRHSQ